MKTTIKTRPFDAAEYLTSEESIASYLGSALESGDSAVMLNAINTAAKARGMAQIAEVSGLGRESLYKALRADAKPRFDTIVKVLSALGVKVVVQPVGGITASGSRAAGGSGRAVVAGASSSHLVGMTRGAEVRSGRAASVVKGGSKAAAEGKAVKKKAVRKKL